MTLTIDLIAGISLFAAINLVYIGALSTWLDRRAPLTTRTFSALGFVTAWWAFWLGLAFTDLGLAEPRLLQASQLLSGFVGPLLLLFTLAYTGRLRRLTPRAALLLLPGLFGTVSFLLLVFLDPPIYREVARAFIARTAPFDIDAIDALYPWYGLLQAAHGLQLFLCTFASIALFVRWARRQATRRDRIDGITIAGIYATMLAGIVATNVLPGMGAMADAPRLAPILALPFVAALYRFVRQRALAVERMAKEKEALLTYLPLGALGDEPGADPARIDLSVLDQPIETQATVLFADLRGFTTFSESLPPDDLIRWIDAFFSRMTACVLEEQGMMDKLIGDAVLAVFGVLPPLGDPCDAAVRAAWKMQAALAELNRSPPIEAEVDIAMGIGIHHGPLVAGSVGSRVRRAYTVFGDTVNTASRIEGLTKVLGASIVISEAVHARLGVDAASPFEACGPQAIRGRHESLEVYRIPRPPRGATSDGSGSAGRAPLDPPPLAGD